MPFSLGPFKIDLEDKLRTGFRVKYNLLVDKVIKDAAAVSNGFKLISHDGSEIEVDLTEYFYSKEILDETFFIDYASETKAGKIRIATVEEAIAGEDDLTAITPYKLLQFWLAMQGRAVIAGEDLTPGTFVYLDDESAADDGTPLLVARKAIASAFRTCVMGFIEYEAAAGDETFIRFSGEINTFQESLVPGEYYYLSDTAAGAITRFPTQTPGSFQQIVGYAISSLELLVEIHRPDKIWDPIFTVPFPELYYEVGTNQTNSVDLLQYLREYNKSYSNENPSGRIMQLSVEEEAGDVQPLMLQSFSTLSTQEDTGLGLALYFSSTGSAELKAMPIRGTAPYSLVAYNESNASVYSTSSSDQEIEIPNSVVSGLGNQTINVVITDADGNTASRSACKVVRDRERIVHAFESVSNGNVSNHLTAINQGDNLDDGQHLTATAIILGEIGTQTDFIKYQTSEFNASGVDVEEDKAFALASTKTYAKRIKLGFHLGRSSSKLNNGSTVTEFYGLEASMMRPGGTVPVNKPGDFAIMIPSPAHPQTLAYAKKLVIGGIRRWHDFITAGVFSWANLVFGNSGEGEYPTHYKDANGNNEEDSRGDFNVYNVALFKNRNQQYVNLSHNDIAGAAYGSQLWLDWAEHHAVVLAEFEANIWEYVYSVYPEIRQYGIEAIDVGSDTDYLSPGRRTQNIKRRVRPSTGMIKTNDNPHSDSRMAFIGDMNTSLSLIYGLCTIAFEPSPTGPDGNPPDFSDPGIRGQVIDENTQTLKPRGISLSFFDHGKPNIKAILSGSSFNQGQLRPGKQHFKTEGGNKVVPTLYRNISEIFLYGSFDGWEGAWSSFRSSQGLTHVDTLSFDDLYNGTSGPIDPIPDPTPNPGGGGGTGGGSGSSTDDGSDDGSGGTNGGGGSSGGGSGTINTNSGWSYRFLGLPAWANIHSVVFDNMVIGGSPTTTGTWKAFLEVIDQTRKRYLHELVLTVYPKTKNNTTLLDTALSTEVGALPGVYPLPDKWDIQNEIKGRHDKWQMTVVGGGDTNSDIDSTVSRDVNEVDAGLYRMFLESNGITTLAGQFRLFITTFIRGSTISRNNISFTLYDEEFEAKIKFFLTKGGSAIGPILLDGTSAFVNPQTYNINYVVDDVEHDKASVKITTKAGDFIFGRDITLGSPSLTGNYNLSPSDRTIGDGGFTAFISLYLDGELVALRYADFVINKPKPQPQGGKLKLVTKKSVATNFSILDTLEASGNVNPLPDDSWDVLSDAASLPFDYEEFVLAQFKGGSLVEVNVPTYTGNPQYIQYPYAITISDFTIFGDLGSKDIGDIHEENTTFRVIVTRRLGGASGPVVAQYSADFSFDTLVDIGDEEVEEPGPKFVDYRGRDAIYEEVIDSIKYFDVRTNNTDIYIDSNNDLSLVDNGVLFKHIQDIGAYTFIGNLTGSTLSPYAVNVVDLIEATVDAGIGLTDSTTGILKTIRLGVPSLIDSTTTNLVSGTTHTHAISTGSLIQGTNITLTGDLTNRLVDTGNVTVSVTDYPWEDLINYVNIIAGDGLVDGGNVENDVTISLGTPSTLNSTSTNTSVGSTHTHAITTGNLVQGVNITVSGDLTNRLIDSGDVTITLPTFPWEDLTGYVNVDSGAGLTGGGPLSSSQTIAMGTPSTLNSTSTNTAVGSTHTHAITTGNIVQGFNVVLSGDLTNRLIDSGDVTIGIVAFPWSGITTKPTTIAGFGIVDAPTISDLTSGLAGKENTFSKGDLIAGSNVSFTGSGSNKLVGSSSVTVSVNSFPWSDITGKPSTLSGYGITDAYTKSEVDSLIAGVPTGVGGVGNGLYGRVAIWNGTGSIDSSAILNDNGFQLSVNGNLVVNAPGILGLPVYSSAPAASSVPFLYATTGGQLRFNIGDGATIRAVQLI